MEPKTTGRVVGRYEPPRWNTIQNTPESNRRLTFQSLSGDKLTAHLQDKVIWQPQAPAIEFQILPDSPAPPERISLQFSAQRRTTLIDSEACVY